MRGVDSSLYNTITIPTDSHGPDPAEANSRNPSSVKKIRFDKESANPDKVPTVSAGEQQGESEPLPLTSHNSSPSFVGYDFSYIRVCLRSTASSFLRAGSRFHGTQKSELLDFDVHVEIKQVDMRESFLCGYFCILGLTKDRPDLTTYFEGEIIGTKYSFITHHQDWGCTATVDLQCWAEFPAFMPFQKLAGKGNLHIANLSQQENIFMRWKEHFLVPDHWVRTISGASFDGFYYICFNQVRGTISGLYFLKKCENMQRLELKHIENRGCFGAIGFR
ncbi:vacuolar import and degradation protein-domain-containing protein [Bisporella sp. PMI_857]|nr:vacuolar import and degradation protein-domain-containing protein [Bisporella sp. PMI_857]